MLFLWSLIFCPISLFRSFRFFEIRIFSLKAADLIVPYLSEGAVKAPPTPAETPVPVLEICFQTAMANAIAVCFKKYFKETECIVSRFDYPCPIWKIMIASGLML